MDATYNLFVENSCSSENGGAAPVSTKIVNDDDLGFGDTTEVSLCLTTTVDVQARIASYFEMEEAQLVEACSRLPKFMAAKDSAQR